MIGLPPDTRVWLAAGITDMPAGFNSLARRRTVLERDPFGGDLFVFGGRRCDLLKVLWWSGDGLCLFIRRLEKGHFIWPQADSGVFYGTLATRVPTYPLDAERTPAGL